MFYVKSIAASVLVALTATSLSAATYTFDLQNDYDDNPDKGDPGLISTDPANQLTITQGDLTGTFTGYVVDNPLYGAGDLLQGSVIATAFEIERHYNGLGIYAVEPCFSKDGDPLHTVDGTSDRELVEMAFTSGATVVDVTLINLTFGWIGDFATYAYGGTNGTFDLLVETFVDGSIGFDDLRLLKGEATPNLGGNTGRGEVDLTTLISEGLRTNSLFGVMAGENGSWKLLLATVD